METILTVHEKQQVSRVSAAVTAYEGCEKRSAEALVRVGAEYRTLKELTGPKRFLEVAKAAHGFSKAHVYQLLKLETVCDVTDWRENTTARQAAHRLKTKEERKAHATETAEAFRRDAKVQQPEEPADMEAEEAAFKESDSRQELANKLVEAGYRTLAKQLHPDVGGFLSWSTEGTSPRCC